MSALKTLLLVALVVLSTRLAAAASIAVLRPARASAAQEEVSYRVQGELLALGLDIQVMVRPPAVRRDETGASAWLEQRATERQLDAVVELVGDARLPAVDVWIFERETRRPRVTRVTLEANAPNAAETLAIRAIEVLRSNFVEIDLAASQRRSAQLSPPAPPAPSAPSPPSPTVTPAEVRREVLGVQAGAAVLTSLQGIGPALLPLVRVDWAFGERLAAQLTLAGLGTRPVIESEAGSASVAQGYGLLGLCYCVPNATGLRPFASLAAGVLRTSLDGEAELPERAHSVGKWSFLAEGGGGARLGFAQRYYLTLAGHVQLAEPYVAVHFVDELVASSGRPNLLASFTVGAWL